jgi:hypothetical protein
LTEQANSLSVGSVLIKSDIPLPKWFRFNCEDDGRWKKLFDADSHAVERTALAVGWHFSFIAKAVKCTALGLTRQSATQRAGRKLKELAGGSGFNSLEITEIAARRWVGLHHVTVVANPRHLQPTPFLQRPVPHDYPHHIEDSEEIFWRAAEVQPQIKGI